MGQNGACNISDHYEFNVIGYRWHDQLVSNNQVSSERRRHLVTQAERLAYEADLQTMFHMSGTTLL